MPTEVLLDANAIGKRWFLSRRESNEWKTDRYWEWTPGDTHLILYSTVATPTTSCHLQTMEAFLSGSHPDFKEVFEQPTLKENAN